MMSLCVGVPLRPPRVLRLGLPIYEPSDPTLRGTSGPMKSSTGASQQSHPNPPPQGIPAIRGTRPESYSVRTPTAINAIYTHIG